MDFVRKIRTVKFPSSKAINYVFCFILPFALIPLVLSEYKESRCAYVIVLMAAYWLLEPVPVAVTALLPVVLFPLTGILNSTDVCINYMKEPLMMFIGGLIIAIAVENCNLHERIALKVLLLIGTDIKWLMAGFMAITAFLSMWISNTATTAMMVPIAEAIVQEMNRDPSEIQMQDSETEKNISEVSADGIEINRNVTAGKERGQDIKLALFLGICYSANIGGTGTLTGTNPNLVFKGILEELHPLSDEITFATWMMYNIPGLVLCVIIGWFYLYMINIRCSKNGRGSSNKENIRRLISCRYRKLGEISFHESAVIVLFLTLVFLWVFRDPKFISGWSDALGSETKIGDSVPSVMIAFLLFLLPSNPMSFAQSPPLLDWKVAQRKLPWGVIILGGGGFSLAAAAQKSGLSRLVGQKMTSLIVLPPAGIVAVLCFMTAMITEVATNTTTANILLPVFSEMAIAVGMNPLYLMLPVTVTCSYAFMLPAATPPNAIAYESANMESLQMAKPGFVMNIVCCAIQLFMINTLGSLMFNVNEFPSWAQRNVSSINRTFVESTGGTSDVVVMMMNESFGTTSRL